jgi:phosphohistidine phosphatase
VEIYLLRHGIAANAKPGQPDSGRALTEEGGEKLRRVLDRAREAGAKPGAILSSPYLRALETAQIAKDALRFEGGIERVDALVPDGSPHDVWDEIRARKSEDAILLAGHEPLMSSLAAFLLGCPALEVEFRKAALMRLDCERFGAQPRARLKWMLTPALTG